MVKGVHKIAMVLSCAIISSALYAQGSSVKKEYNTLYRPIDLIKRASYDNFKKIKLLHASIINFGGGETEFDQLVDQYSEASVLYFVGNLVESANLFTKNEKNIHQVAMRLARDYKAKAEELHKNIIKFHVKNNIKLALQGKKPNPTAELLLNTGNSGIRRANDYLLRNRPIQAIYYFRRAKESCLKYYDVTDQKLPDIYKKDIVDNKNKLYTAKEKVK